MLGTPDRHTCYPVIQMYRRLSIGFRFDQDGSWSISPSFDAALVLVILLAVEQKRNSVVTTMVESTIVGLRVRAWLHWRW